MEDEKLKNLQVKAHLYQEVERANSMILHYIQTAALRELNDIIKPKMFFKTGQETVELTADEFTKLRLVLTYISSEDGQRALGDGSARSYIEKKEEKLQIIRMLS